ncbi:class I SAM-dependent methyltransferase [Flavobacterium silvaticum]|uniref:Class I SAM-dependent methyltransferase n=1 Tax=Flavobacterium silvaticum TaxID=1852020 RepID=A0A972FP26_9FLAO|nr:class I SAM-dependent methyltransferase [Flavobacterium silvaticum]NMH29222.1 class I SAM-dependent methyltransferase [Flavobacterium silvaticum]
MKDNFSEQSVSYARFRPSYPEEVVQYITSFTKHKNTVLDVATGNGQLAVKLADLFEKVIGIDISEKQLSNATLKPNIEYLLRPAENCGFDTATFDLVTVAQAIHWFDFNTFYPEVYRILKPDGIFAILGYGLFSTNSRADKILKHFYNDIIGPYWDKERKYIDENYETIPFPFDEIKVQHFSADYEWSFAQLTGYLDSWSAVAHYKKKVGIDPVDLIRHELALVWELSDRKVHFPLLLRIGKPYKRG